MSINYNSIEQSKASGEDVSRVVGRMSDIFKNEENHIILMSALSIAIMVQQPDVTPEQLKAGVLGASQWIALYLTSIEESGTIPKEQIN